MIRHEVNERIEERMALMKYRRAVARVERRNATQAWLVVLFAVAAVSAALLV